MLLSRTQVKKRQTGHQKQEKLHWYLVNCLCRAEDSKKGKNYFRVMWIEKTYAFHLGTGTLKFSYISRIAIDCFSFSRILQESVGWSVEIKVRYRSQRRLISRPRYWTYRETISKSCHAKSFLAEAFWTYKSFFSLTASWVRSTRRLSGASPTSSS